MDKDEVILNCKIKIINIIYVFNKNKRREKRQKLKNDFFVKQLTNLKIKLVDKYPGHFILVPYLPWGDFFAICSILCNLKSQHPFSKILVLCDNQNRADVIKSFPSIDAVEFISKEEYLYFCSPSFENSTLEIGNMFAISHWQKTNNKRFLPKNIFKFYANLLSLENNYKKETPIFSVEDRNIAFMHYKKLNLGPKTIFISPNAVSFDYTIISSSFWINLANKLIKSGYDVVFNSNDNIFKGFNNIFLPMCQQIEFAKLCNWIIGFRSGLMDAFAASEINNIITIYPPTMNFLTISREDMKKEFKKSFYYEDDKTFEENVFNICSLNKTFETNKFKEFIFDNDEDKLEQQILTSIADEVTI